ncbi:hypothetical protein CLIB1423_08S01926 [[Candida] railenensis]|uniref:Uncharacterized protein n=1 Tax=[Candida] railenensis TaxID=45579 RepID=A0A9P0VXS4_9ASCO|nr:hypothetical protein CLIB1423_08S01926 [[Candida] railenensis]
MAKRKSKSKLSFNLDHDHGDTDTLLVKKITPSDSAPIFTKKKKSASLPSKPQFGTTDIYNEATIVPETEVYRTIDMATHILSNYTQLNIQNLINDSTPLGLVKLHLFRAYLYSVQFGQADQFFWYPPNSEYQALFKKLFSDIETITIDVSHNWEGTTFKDRFISKNSITPVKIGRESDSKKRVVKKIKVNHIVLKRLGIPT